MVNNINQEKVLRDFLAQERHCPVCGWETTRAEHPDGQEALYCVPCADRYIKLVTNHP